MGSQELAAHEVVAFNIAAASENKIHDDSIARRFGFNGALVPGVAIYAYMAHLPVTRWGRAWLECGEAECRFRKPVYDGDIARVTAAEENGGLALAVDCTGIQCATGHAFMPAQPHAAPEIARVPAPIPPRERPQASETSLAAGTCLGIAPLTIDAATLAHYLDAIRETDPIYRNEGLLHPGQILQLANRALVENVVLGPWIHLSSEVRHHAIARIGEQLTLRAAITSNQVVKGHATVEFDAIAIANGTKIIAEIKHTAIWRPRQEPEAD
ncbi:MAG: hypothetical protein ABSE22_19080 [Xanthobacteraceae bacterium]|jgi:acyl dehydratase